MRAEIPSPRRPVLDPGPNWIRSGEDLLQTDPVERVVFTPDEQETLPPDAAAAVRRARMAASRPPEPVPGTHPTPVPTRERSTRSVPPAPVRNEAPGKAVARRAKSPTSPPPEPPRPSRLKLAPSLPPMIAPDSLPPIYDDEAFIPSCRAVDQSYTGVVSGVRAAGRSWELSESSRPILDAPVAEPLVSDPSSDNADKGDDEASTGLFEPWEDPYGQRHRMGPVAQPNPLDEPSATVPGESHYAIFAAAAAASADGAAATRPSLTLVRSVSQSVEEEFAGMRAEPPATEPRPYADEVVDWPPPMERPGIDYPDDWNAEDVGNTLIVIDPLQRQERSRLGVLMLDLAAWVLGFVAMFLTGLVTTGSAALVGFALSL